MVVACLEDVAYIWIYSWLVDFVFFCDCGRYMIVWVGLCIACGCRLNLWFCGLLVVQLVVPWGFVRFALSVHYLFMFRIVILETFVDCLGFA